MRLGLKLTKKKNALCNRIQPQWAKLYIELNRQKIEAKQNGEKDQKC